MRLLQIVTAVSVVLSATAANGQIAAAGCPPLHRHGDRCSTGSRGHLDREGVRIPTASLPQCDLPEKT